MGYLQSGLFYYGPQQLIADIKRNKRRIREPDYYTKEGFIHKIIKVYKPKDYHLTQDEYDEVYSEVSYLYDIGHFWRM